MDRAPCNSASPNCSRLGCGSSRSPPEPQPTPWRWRRSALPGASSIAARSRTSTPPRPMPPGFFGGGLKLAADRGGTRQDRCRHARRSARRNPARPAPQRSADRGQRDRGDRPWRGLYDRRDPRGGRGRRRAAASSSIWTARALPMPWRGSDAARPSDLASGRRHHVVRGDKERRRAVRRDRRLQRPNWRTRSPFSCAVPGRSGRRCGSPRLS